MFSFIFHLFFLFVVSIISSIFMFFLVKKLFLVLKILDNPKKYNKTREAVPYSMGIIFFISFFLISFIFVEHSHKLELIWLFGFLITLISFIDDRISLNPKIRLLIQVLIGGIIGITSIKIGYISNIFGGIINLETYFIEILNLKIYLIPLIFTIIWYVFIFNSLNWTDGIPGNTSLISISSFFVLFSLGMILYFRDNYIGGVQNALFIIKISLILIGILIPFFFFDIEEKVLMGDTGTMFLGFMLASLAIISGGKIATVLLVFGIYSVDAIYVILKRIINKKNPLTGDFTHLHHRLIDRGLTKKQTVYFISFFSFLFGILSLFFDKLGKIIIFIFIIFFVIFIEKIVEILKLGK